GHDFEYLPQFQLFGMTPPFTYGWLTIHGEEFRHRDEEWRFTAFALMGLFGWAVATGILWAPTSERFRYITGRQRLKRPERRPIPLPPPVPVPVPVADSPQAVVLEEVRGAPLCPSGEDVVQKGSPPTPENGQTPSTEKSAVDDPRQSI